jgi:fermentation-respiration switch protein FrsA (DUF1100 family)
LLVIAVVTALVGLTLVGLALWAWQERLVWQPPPPPYPGGGRVHRGDYRAADGQPLFAYVVEPPAPRAGGAGGGAAPNVAGRDVVLAFHGNADLAAWQIPWGEELARRTGAVVVLAEYRAYAGLPGRPTYEGARLDARAAYDFARSLGADPARVTVYGHSLGTAVAGELVAQVRPRALVLQSPFTSAREMARLIAPSPVLLGWRAIARVHFDTERRARELDAPVWVAHGERDRIIPVRFGRRVYEAARVKGELLLVPGAGHNDVAEAGGEAYWRWLEKAVGR